MLFHVKMTVNLPVDMNPQVEPHGRQFLELRRHLLAP